MAPAPSGSGSTDFWNLLIKLDNAVGGKRGKSLQRLPSGSSSNGSVSESAGASSGSFDVSPLGQLMTMVAHPVVRRSQLLTDRLLRLLSLVSVGLGDAGSSAPANTSGCLFISSFHRLIDLIYVLLCLLISHIDK